MTAGFERSALPCSIWFRVEGWSDWESTFSPSPSAAVGDSPGPTPPRAAPLMASCRWSWSPQNASSPNVSNRNVWRPSVTRSFASSKTSLPGGGGGGASVQAKNPNAMAATPRLTRKTDDTDVLVTGSDMTDLLRWLDWSGRTTGDRRRKWLASRTTRPVGFPILQDLHASLAWIDDYCRYCSLSVGASRSGTSSSRLEIRPERPGLVWDDRRRDGRHGLVREVVVAEELLALGTRVLVEEGDRRPAVRDRPRRSWAYMWFKSTHTLTSFIRTMSEQAMGTTVAFRGFAQPSGAPPVPEDGTGAEGLAVRSWVHCAGAIALIATAMRATRIFECIDGLREPAAVRAATPSGGQMHSAPRSEHRG